MKGNGVSTVPRRVAVEMSMKYVTRRMDTAAVGAERIMLDQHALVVFI